MCLAAKEAMRIARLMTDLLNFKISSAIALGVDNNGAIESVKNVSVNQCNKHIDLQYHFVRDAAQSKKIVPRHVASTCQLADFLQNR